MRPVYGILVPHRGNQVRAVDNAHGNVVACHSRTKDGSLFLRMFRQVEGGIWYLNPEGESCDAVVRLMREDPHDAEILPEGGEPCPHWLRVDRYADSISCDWCSFAISGQALHALGFAQRDVYTKAGRPLAEEAQRLRDENRELLIENAQLRRAMERRAKGTRND